MRTHTKDSTVSNGEKRGPGRRPNAIPNRSVSITMPQPLFDILDEAHWAARQSVSEFVVTVLTNHFRDAGLIAEAEPEAELDGEA